MRKWIASILLTIHAHAFSQDNDLLKPDSARKEINAIKIGTGLRVDGILNEAEWKLGNNSPRFVQIEPIQGGIPNFETYVRALYNKNYLYFGIFAKDSLGRKAIRATDFKRDFDYRQHDMLSLSFDGFNDRRNAMLISSNAYGVQRDMLSFDDLYFDLDWDGLWRVRTSRTDSGWYAEIAIPWKTLRYPRSRDSVQKWGLNVYRNRRLSNEISAFSEYPRVYSILRMEYAGILQNLEPPKPKTNIRVQPYVLSSFDHYKNFDSSVKSKETNFKLGADVKWAINPNAILDLTVNTDFAQVDADRQVNNVTRFSVFFPERRQFFLENASLFSFGIGPNDDESGGTMRVQPFFSRRIGLDDNGNPIPIDVGARFVHRSLKRNYGAIGMRQRKFDTIPTTNFVVARYSENLGRQNRIGGLVTVKENSTGTDIVSTIDGFFRIREAHSINSIVMHSTSSNTGKHGFAAFAQYYYITNRMKIWWTQSVVTKDFNPSLGFVSRNDVIGTTPGIYYYYRGKRLPIKKWIRAYEPSVGAEFYHQASTGKLVERLYFFTPLWLNLQSGGYIGYIIIPYYQRLLEPFEPLGVDIAPGEYNYTRHRIAFATDQSKVISLSGDYQFGTYFNGKLNSGTWKLQFAPIPYISLTGTFNRNKFMEVGEPKTNRIVDLYGVEGRFALNPRIQLIGFYQRNSENNAENYNIRLAWEYQPLSYVYLVFNRRQFEDTGAKLQSENHFIAKVSYLRQF